MEPLIDTAFPGGNIVVEKREGSEFWLHQDLRDTETDWFYWCFRVRGAAGQSLTFHFTQSLAIGVRGPAFSLDQGLSWEWLGRQNPAESFTFLFPTGVDDVRFSFGMPYQVAQWEVFSNGLQVSELCRSDKGRSIPKVCFGANSDVSRYRVLLTCRHHCCEMMASYSLEGLIAYVQLSGESEATWLRSNTEFLAMPFMDIDGVEEGDQGKNRKPHDHNRDYKGESIYASVRTVREMVPKWSEGRLCVALDLHCPWIHGIHHEEIYLVGDANPVIAEQQKIFSRLIEANAAGGLPFSAGDFLPFGEDWNKGGGAPFHSWAATLPNIRLCAGIEIPYANARGAEVNQSSARLFGVTLAKALTAYLKEIES
jgi:hypothetical protein